MPVCDKQTGMFRIKLNQIYFSAKKSLLLKAAVIKRQAAFPVVSHSI